MPLTADRLARLYRRMGLSGDEAREMADITARQLVADGPVEIFVNAKGNDGNQGLSSAQAVRTIGEAFSRLAHVIASPSASATITVEGGGTYTEEIRLAVQVIQDTIGGTAKLLIRNTVFNTPTLDGITSGTVTSRSGAIVTVTGGGWTADELEGIGMKITSGSLSGRTFYINTNAGGDTFEIPFHNPAIAGETFEFVTPAAKLSGAAFMIASPTAQRSAIRIQGFDIAMSDVAGTTVGHGTGCTFESCRFVGTGTIAVFSSGGAAVELVDCFIASTHVLGISTSEFSKWILKSTPIKASNTGVDMAANSVLQIDQSGGAKSIIDGPTTGFGVRNLCSIFATRFIVRGGTLGFNANAPSAMEFDSAEIRDQSSHGIIVRTKVNGNGPGGSATISLSGCTVDGCGGDGVNMDDVGVTLDLSGATISNCGGWAVDMAPTLRGGHSLVQTSSTTVISGNTAGDFTLDGVADSTLVALRAASPKELVEATLKFNRLVEV